MFKYFHIKEKLQRPLISDKQHVLDTKVDKGQEQQKQREVAKKGMVVPRSGDIMSKIRTQKDVSIASAFKDDKIPAAGVLTDHQAQLTKVTFCW